ncbi:MAG: DUF192 domain-containing protein [Anaerolineae bacterium]
MQVLNQTRGTVLVRQGHLADTFWTRLRGLLGSRPLTNGQGLVLKNEKSIHTFFMTFSIDVIYANDRLRVIRLDKDMRPYRLGPFVRDAAYILELPVGTIDASRTVVNDQLSFQMA